MISDNRKAHGIAVRFGGEEFMLVLSDCSQQRAMELLEQHGYIWRDTPLYSGVGRPPSLTIYVNPMVAQEQ